tara:strand:- start:573 stop:710 length:138 start_codon:yes stop_codon:yes gene_type:complete
MNDTGWQKRTDAWVKAQHEERRKKEQQNLTKKNDTFKLKEVQTDE